MDKKFVIKMISEIKNGVGICLTDYSKPKDVYSACQDLEQGLHEAWSKLGKIEHYLKNTPEQE